MAPSVPQSLFGEWCCTSVGTAHYFLNGSALCGAQLGATGPVYFEDKKRVTNKRQPLCGLCYQRNYDRWSGTEAKTGSIKSKV